MQGSGKKVNGVSGPGLRSDVMGTRYRLSLKDCSELFVFSTTLSAVRIISDKDKPKTG